MRLLLFLLSCATFAQTVDFNVRITFAPPGSTNQVIVLVNGKPLEAGPGSGTVDPPALPLPPLNVPTGFPPKFEIRTDLPSIAYDPNALRAPDKPWKLKAGESLRTEFGTLLSRLTDETTSPGSKLFTHFYSATPPLCGSNLALAGDGGSTLFMKVGTNKVTGLNFRDPERLTIRYTYWHPTDCDTLYMTAANFQKPNQFELWKYTPSTDKLTMVRDFSADIDKKLPGITGAYITLAWISPNADRFLFGIEYGSKKTPGVMLLDENGVRVYKLNPVPATYQPTLASNFQAAGVSGVTQSGSHYFVMYNGQQPGINSMSYVIPWNANPETFGAYSIYGKTPTYHGSTLPTGIVHITGAQGGAHGAPLDPAREECKAAFPACAGAPNWWYTLRVHDFTVAPNAETGYPGRDTLAHTLAVGGYHLMSSQGGAVVLSSTYQERGGGDDYLLRSPLHNEIFLTFPGDPGVKWIPDVEPWGSGGYVRPQKQARIVRLAGVNTKPWLHEPYWGSPRAALSASGCEVIFASTNGETKRVDLFMISGYCKP